jgi:hypothetical protein
VSRIGTQSLAGIARSARSLCIGTTGSHVPYKSLIQVHAAFEPDAAWAGLQVSAQALSQSDHHSPVSTSTLRFRQFIDGLLSLVSLDLT